MKLALALVLVLAVVGHTHAASTRKLSDKNYRLLKALADEYGVPCTPQMDDLAASIKEITARNIERTTTLNAECEYRESEAQRRFTNATLANKVVLEAARAASEAQRLKIEGRAQAQFDETLQGLQSVVDLRAEGKGNASKAVGFQQNVWNEAKSSHENTLEIAATNRATANESRTASMAALTITRDGQTEDAETTYVVEGLGGGRRVCVESLYTAHVLYQ